MVIAQECGQFDFRRVLRELSVADMERWAALFRIQAKEQEKSQQDRDAQAARARADAKLARGAE